ncbi:MAG: hypothetical protein JOZ43_04450 [Acidobacteriales bacterium]|nr:hypothetical protein [Terriglobales bacterium]
MKLPRHMEMWLPWYVQSRAAGWFTRREPKRVWLTICDHYEPMWGRPAGEVADGRVALWRERWPELADEAGPDSRGAKAKYSFFYPQDEYDARFLDPLSELVGMGLADVEIHIHHDGEGRTAFIEKMAQFMEVLHERHGLLRRVDGRLAFGFIHGNWALDNSRPDGRWCGLNDEITILKELGCYADFTMPSAPDVTQVAMVNEIYWATDDPARPKSHDRGEVVRPGGSASGDLLMITGPLGFRWRERLVPRMETGEVAGNDPATEGRVQAWFRLAPMIGDDLFIKLHTHGTQERNSRVLIEEKNLVRMYQWVRAEAERRGAEVVFASAFEMYQGVRKAAGMGEVGVESAVEVRQ